MEKMDNVEKVILFLNKIIFEIYSILKMKGGKGG